MLIARYIFRQTASALIMILVSLTLIVWLISLFRDLKLLTSQGQTFILFMKITALTLPKLLVIVAPVAFLIASLHTLNRLNGDSELIVLSASGSSAWRLLVPYFVLGSIVFAGVLAANLFVLPPAERLFNDYVSQIRADVLSQVLQPGEFTDLPESLGSPFHMRAKSRKRRSPGRGHSRRARQDDRQHGRSRSGARSGATAGGRKWTFTTDKYCGSRWTSPMCSSSLSTPIPSTWATSAPKPASASKRHRAS